MLKVLALLSARHDLSREAFIAYYEERHVPLALRLLPMPRRYRRNYVQPAPPGSAAIKPDFDCITELIFDDQAALDALLARLQEPETSALIAADEAQFLDRAKSRMVFVEERSSDG